MRYGRTVEPGFLPAYSVDTEEEAKLLLAMACPMNLRGDYIAPELAEEQTLERLRAFGERLEAMHARMSKKGDDGVCPMCGRRAKKRPRTAKLRYSHKCPHGKWCAQGMSDWGVHSNGRPPPRQKCCAPRAAQERE